MKKTFNTTGACISTKHYMININNKLNQIKELIDNESYFTINKPNQYGKTTMLNQLEEFLKDEYLIIKISFESIEEDIFKDECKFVKSLISLMSNSSSLNDQEDNNRFIFLCNNVEGLYDLSSIITKFVREYDREIVLLVDDAIGD